MAGIEALYCHLPFCHTICPFCAFAVHGNRPHLHGPYLEALGREIALLAAEHDGKGQRIAALYFGGGTPSTLSLENVRALLGKIAAGFHLAPDAEIAFELNPEDANENYLRGLADAGINRVSLGLQSLDAHTLRALRRNHGAGEGLRAVEAVQAAGLENFNLDLMFGVPEIPEAAFEGDLEKAVAMRPAHISLYGLDLEEGTPFARDPAIQEWMTRHTARQAGQFLRASDTLATRGYRHYEVSNFCLPGREGRQNLVVWNGGNYLGFGTGAHSHLEGQRWHNERHLRAYQRRLAAGELPVAYRETLTREKLANEELMLALRQAGGLDVTRWEKRYGFAWASCRAEIARRLQQEGKARWDGQTLALTPQGFLVADAITAQLMVE